MQGLVIGGGPSVFQYKHLELLSKSNFKGYLLITDRMLKPCLQAGITPDKFRNFYVFTVEDMWKLQEYLDDVKEAPKINLVHSTRTKKTLLDRYRELGYRLILDKWPYLDVTDNVGLMAFHYGVRISRCSKMIMIGMDSTDYGKLVFNEGTDCYNKFYKKVNGYNLTPLEQLWHDGFMDLLELVPDYVEIINATGGGVLINPRIKPMPFEDCLNG